MRKDSRRIYFDAYRRMTLPITSAYIRASFGCLCMTFILLEFMLISREISRDKHWKSRLGRFWRIEDPPRWVSTRTLEICARRKLGLLVSSPRAAISDTAAFLFLLSQGKGILGRIVACHQYVRWPFPGGARGLRSWRIPAVAPRIGFRSPQAVLLHRSRGLGSPQSDRLSPDSMLH